MRISCVLLAVILISVVDYSSCTVLATKGYILSSPTIRNLLVNSGLSNLISRKSNALYEISNFRYASDRGTDIKKAEMDNFDIVEMDPQTKTARTGLQFQERNYTKEDDRLYSEKLFGVLTEMDKNGCISRLLCETGADPKSFGIIGFKMNSYLKSVPPVTWNSVTFPYLESFQAGLRSGKETCELNYASCNYDLRRVMKFLWPFLKPIGMKLATGL